MTSPSFFRLVFVLYCAEAGIFLLTAPWFPAWDRLAFAIPWGALRDLLLSSWTRGAVASFGALHLLWVLHDVDLFLRRRGSVPYAASETARGQ